MSDLKIYCEKLEKQNEFLRNKLEGTICFDFLSFDDFTLSREITDKTSSYYMIIAERMTFLPPSSQNLKKIESVIFTRTGFQHWKLTTYLLLKDNRGEIAMDLERIKVKTEILINSELRNYLINNRWL